MGYTVGVHPFNETEVVYMIGNLRKETGDMATAVPVLFEGPRAFKYSMLFYQSSLSQHSSVIEFKHPTVVLFQPGLVIEGIHMTRAALHEQENNPFGSRNKMSLPGP